jgi:solute carrier family 24 (sodium/potassium/calcium exchanger), member 6
VYLSPALTAISLKLQCSQSLAGVTLLALGNGAPDVFSALSAGGTTESQINLQMSALFGSVFYVASFVMYMTLQASKQEDGSVIPINVTRNCFIRDSVFLLLTSAYTLVILLWWGYFSVPIAVGYLVIYAIFVTIVIV